MSKAEIRLGLTEAAHIGADVPGNMFLRLSERVKEAEKMGFPWYEAMPGWGTAVEVLGPGKVSTAPGLGLYQIAEGVINIHESWLLDRRMYPKPAANDTLVGYALRYPISLLTSVPFLGNMVVRRLAALAPRATVSTHWPHQMGMEGLSPRQEQLRRRQQAFLDGLDAVVLAENHALLGMSDEEMETWLNGDKRGLAIVSGADERDKEYANRSKLNLQRLAGKVRGVYVKKGWEPEVLKRDLGMILEANPQAVLWLMVNYSAGANAKTAETLQGVVSGVLKG